MEWWVSGLLGERAGPVRGVCCVRGSVGGWVGGMSRGASRSACIKGVGVSVERSAGDVGRVRLVGRPVGVSGVGVRD